MFPHSNEARVSFSEAGDAQVPEGKLILPETKAGAAFAQRDSSGFTR